MLLPIIFVIICAPSFISGQTQDEIINNPNNFHLFENFELTRALYINETKIVRRLQELRENLIERKKNVQKLLDLTKEKSTCDNPAEALNFVNKIPDVMKTMEKLTPVKSFFKEMNDLAQEFPTEQDHKGAVGAIVRLQFAYEIDLTELSENRRIKYVNSDGENIIIDNFEQLTSVDFAGFAQKATERRLYHVAIDFARESLRLHKSKDEGVRTMAPGHYELLQKIRKDLIQLNNGYLTKKKQVVDREFIIHPYLIDDDLKKKKKQPKFVTEGKIRQVKRTGEHELTADWLFMKVCREGRQKQPFVHTKEVNCRFLHHKDPYLKLGPFKEEQKSERPYAVVFHDILSDIEMNYLVEEATPNLSRKRYNSDDIQDALAKHEFGQGKKVKIIHKTVQAWLPEADFNVTDKDLENLNSMRRPEIKVIRPILWKLAHKITLATQLQTQSVLSGTAMQVTNYGLGGLCEQHIDPHGYLEGNELPRSRENLKYTGDMMGTFMAWLKDVDAGGGTSYLIPGFDGTIMPEKGAASFWYDLTSEGYRDRTTQHGGCPVLKGSKWILNKWMYYFDNFAKFPCALEKGEPGKGITFPQPAVSHYF